MSAHERSLDFYLLRHWSRMAEQMAADGYTLRRRPRLSRAYKGKVKVCLIFWHQPTASKMIFEQTFESTLSVDVQDAIREFAWPPAPLKTDKVLQAYV